MHQRSFKLNTRCLLALLFSITFVLCLLVGRVSAIAQSPDSEQLVQQGFERYQAGDYKGAIAPWRTALTQYQKTSNQTSVAIVLENLARVYQQLGQSEAAIAHWQKLIELHCQQKNLAQLGRALTEQAQAYSSNGQPKQAIVLLCGSTTIDRCSANSALQLARTAKDPLGEASALGSLGDALRLTGKYDQSIHVLQLSLELPQTTHQISVFNSLGNVYSSRASVNKRRSEAAGQRQDEEEQNRFKQAESADNQQAVQYFQQSLRLAKQQNNTLGQLRSLVSLIPIYYRTGSISAGTAALRQAIPLLTQLPTSQERVYMAIDLARLLNPAKTGCPQSTDSSEAETILQQAVTVAQRIQDSRAESFALGELGHLYECQGKLAQALDFTQKARWAAEQNLNAKDSLYLWEWQSGRLLKAQDQTTEAIASYERAVATLEDIRSDLLTTNRELQFDFRDTVEPVYRELIDLRLSLEKPEKTANSILKAQGAKPSTTDNSNLTRILSRMDSLRLAELQNYFGNDCVIAAINQIRNASAKTDESAAIFSSIISNSKVAIIVKLSNNDQLQIKLPPVAPSQFKQEINDFRQQLEAYYDKEFDLNRAKRIYQWIIEPFATALDSQGIKTLVFVHDGLLRSIPMAALHDGKQYLVEKYAIATTPSLSLTDLSIPDRNSLTALALGVTQETTVEGREYVALPYVETEIQGLKSILPGSKALMDKDFKHDRLEQVLRQQVFPIIHIATHGQFSDEPEDTFLVTGDSQKLTITELDQLIRRVVTSNEPIALLALTACQTAVGDDRAALGLAGVAVQAGAKSALASLWFINDATTAALTKSFYRNLATMSKATSLQMAQKTLIQAGRHPAYWAPFVLVGNWR